MKNSELNQMIRAGSVAIAALALVFALLAVNLNNPTQSIVVMIYAMVLISFMAAFGAWFRKVFR